MYTRGSPLCILYHINVYVLVLFYGTALIMNDADQLAGESWSSKLSCILCVTLNRPIFFCVVVNSHIK